ncbi:MAG: SDR family NAD(P)-dependent oxidoreductase [Eubacteriales bacterium]
MIVTGGSSGIGLSTARCLAAQGCTVYSFSRRQAAPDGIIHRSVDVTDRAALEQTVADVVAQEGRVDLLINNAGFGIAGTVEHTDPALARSQLDVNFWGMVNATRAVLPYMRARQSGRIVNISSVAALVPIPFQTYYSVSKAAINAFTMATANEVRPLGIGVCAVMPGDTQTDFTDARKKAPADDGSVYAARMNRSLAKMEQDERRGMDAGVAGRLIARIALARKCRPLYTLGFSYQLIALLTRLLPARAVNYLLYRLYAQ